MEIEELLIDNDPSISVSTKQKNPVSYFNTGEWKKGLSISAKLFLSSSTPLTTLIDIYKAGCSLACKLIEGSNIKLGIQITKKLNKLLPSDKVEQFIQYQCEVLNYIACAYKEIKKLYLARKYIEKAMLIVQDFPQIFWDKSNTYLNMCAILSAMGKHSEALNYAKTAIILAKEEIVEASLHKDKENISKKIAVLAIAYNNYAVEAEHLGNLQDSIEFYKKAYKYLRTHDPENVTMMQRFKESFLSAKKMALPKTRPTSARSAKSQYSQKSTKSLATFKNLSPRSAAEKKTAKLGTEKKTVNLEKKTEKMSLEKKTVETGSEKNFLVFKTECQDFLSSNNEWFKRNLGRTQELATNKGEASKGRPPLKPEFKPTKAVILETPIMGVENFRKPVVHEILAEKPKTEEILEPVPLVEAHSIEKPYNEPQPPFYNIIPQQPVAVFQDFEEIKPKIQPAENTAPVFPPLNLDPTYLKSICKIQARVRGYQTRERVNLLKSKPEILYRGGKKINDIWYFITISKKKGKVLVIISNGIENQSVLAPAGMSPEELFKNIDKRDKQIFFRTKEESVPELIKTVKLEIENQDFEVKFSYDARIEKLFIQATKCFNSQVFCLEKKNLSFESRKLLLEYIEEIEPKLKIKEQKLVINKENVVIERIFLAKGLRIIEGTDFLFTVYRVVLEDGDSVEIYAECASMNIKSTLIFEVSEIIQKLSILKIKKVEEDPHSILLLLHFENGKVVLRKLEKDWARCLYNQKAFYNKTEYTVKVYKLKDDPRAYFFQVCNKDSPPITSHTITAQALSEIFRLSTKKIKNSLNRIVKNIIIKSDTISFNTQKMKSETFIAREIMIIVKIQSLIRGHLLRDRMKLAANSTPLVYKCTKEFEQKPAFFHFFRVQNGLFIESLFPDFRKSFYLFIHKPQLFFYKYSRLFDIKCISNMILFNSETFIISSPKGDLTFLECSFVSQDEQDKSPPWPIIKYKLNTVNDYIMLIRELSHSSLLVKVLRLSKKPFCSYKTFSKSDIIKEEKSYKSELFAKKIEMVKDEVSIHKENKEAGQEPIGERVLFRTIKRFENKLYQVVLSLSQDLMVFNFKQGSESHSEIRVEVPQAKAFELSGYNEDMLIPMADFMIRKMFVMENNAIVLVEPTVKFNFDKTLKRIQAAAKGFLTRKFIKKRLNFQLILKTTIKIDNQNYKALLYHACQDYSLCLMKFPVILTKKLNKRLVKDNLHRLDKVFLSKVMLNLTIKEKNGVLSISGLKAWKKGSSLEIKVHETSQVSSLTNRSGSVISLNSPHMSKMLKLRSSRSISGQKCVVSIYEAGIKGLIEVLIVDSDETLYLEVPVEAIRDPELLVTRLEIRDGKIIIREEDLRVVASAKKYISNKLVEIAVFATDRGLFATAYLPGENKSLNTFLGNEILPEEAIKRLQIKEVMGQDALILVNNG